MGTQTAIEVDDISAMRMIRAAGPMEPGGPFGYIAPNGKRYGGFKTRSGAKMEATLAGHGDVEVKPCDELLFASEKSKG